MWKGYSVNKKSMLYLSSQLRRHFYLFYSWTESSCFCETIQVVSVHYSSKMLVDVRTELNKTLIGVHKWLHWKATCTAGDITCHKQNKIMKMAEMRGKFWKVKQETIPGGQDVDTTKPDQSISIDCRWFIVNLRPSLYVCISLCVIRTDGSK